MRFSIYQDSLTGARRVNQDRMGYCFTRDSLLMLVADGMGGHPRGEVAARIGLQAAARAFQVQARPTLAEPSAFLDLAFRRGHREILRFQQRNRLPEAPRTTIVACVIQQGRVWWAHAGDSRFYWLRGQAILARTRDHSALQNLIDLGLLDPRDTAGHPDRNKVLNCLGSPFDPVVEIGGPRRIEPGDTLLLCSDGVWASLPDPEVVSMLALETVLLAVPRLVRRAVKRSGAIADNATALAMTWEGEEDRASGTSPALLGAEGVTSTICVDSPGGAGAGEPPDSQIARVVREIRDKTRTGGS